jgi:shikimate dehydrogenase
MNSLIGLIGHPLGHSISPVFQQAALDHHGLSIRYQSWEVDATDIMGCVRQLASSRILGANVTLPYKEVVGSWLDELTEEAGAIGAVNTIVNRKGVLVGYNTDAYGFLRALREEAAFDPRGKTVLVLGAGGVARAAIFALATAGVGTIILSNRTLPRAQRLAQWASTWVKNIHVVALQGLRLCKGWELVVNCTTVGMVFGNEEKSIPIDAGLISRDVLVYDLVYNPMETPLLKVAKGVGAETLGGLSMLIYQGAESFKIWTGIDPSLEVMFKAARQALKP